MCVVMILVVPVLVKSCEKGDILTTVCLNICSRHEVDSEILLKGRLTLF